MYDKDFFARYRPPASLLDDKVILVTGAGDGIGKTTALTFANYGATVILLGRTLQKLEAVYDQIERAGQPQPAIFPMNLEGATEHDYQAMYNSINEEFGRLDGLLHNAAELGPRTPLAHYPLSDWEKLVRVNLTAPFLMTQALLPLLNNATDASIVFTGSSVGLRGRAYWGAYAVTKAGAENLMQTLADELADTTHIRVNSINPGGTRTRMRASAYPAEDPETVKPAEAIMAHYLFLMGGDSAGVSGKQFDAQPK